MADYPAKRAYRGKGPWEREAIRNGSPPEFNIGDRVTILYGGLPGRINNLELRHVDPPVWCFEVHSSWYFASELKKGNA